MFAFDLVGGWTSPLLFLRLLTIVEGDWEPLRTGFTNRRTGERAKIAFSPASPALAATFGAGADPFHPTIDLALEDEIGAHKAVISVSDAGGTADPPLRRALTLARAAGAAVNGGALAVRCRTSGLAHAADAFQALVAAADAADAGGDEDALAEALLGLYVLHVPTREPISTYGMHALGVPDVSMWPTDDEDRDLARLRAAALARIRGRSTSPATPDDRGLPAPLHNPHGVAPA